ncbi:hypothetical protein QQX98_000041 [Neonectria punicea]|uniref:Uncharacterized protein n=1 Tax=Neonectria punicea TaxID=979145 RepID=A0ABR1HVA6_9HYPO
MIPVNPSRLDSIVKRKEICLLNQTRFTIHFVSSLVNHSPRNIATKQGNKQLPLELWREIVAWAETDPRHHTYCLVQAQFLEEHGAQRIVVCAEIPERDTCGLLETDGARNEYHAYLQRPGEGHDPKRPFVLPDANNQDSLIKIKDSLLGPDSEILFRALSVPDVISWVEEGECFICDSEGWVFLYRDYDDDGFFGCGLPYGIIGSSIPCPLCIHMGIPESIDELESEEYRRETRETFEEFGYIFDHAR